MAQQLAEQWVPLHATVKKDWDKRSKEDFRASAAVREDEEKAEIREKKQKKTQKRKGRIETLAGIKARVRELLEASDLAKTSVNSIREELSGICDPVLLDANKSNLKKFISDTVKDIQSRDKSF